MRFLLTLLLVFLSNIVSADDLARIAGKYNYEQYQLILGDGRTLSMNDIGAKNITIEFKKDSTILMTMNMLNGEVITTEALIKEINIEESKGYWIAQWPDMTYTVRKDFSFHDDFFEYEIKFENKQDPLRYGSVEHAVLKKSNAF